MDCESDSCENPELSRQLLAMSNFRQLVKSTWGNPSAVQTLVALHDIVTGSIDPIWMDADRMRVYCVNDAVGLLPEWCKDDIPQFMSYNSFPASFIDCSSA